jgi:mono/diheme cytochrome c family protein
MLGCPTADAPAYGTGASAALTLSEPYRTTCARCHGASGEGQPLYPALPGQLDRAAFIEVVRRGKGTAMPAFPAAFVSDSELARDFDALAKRPTGQSATGLPNAGEWAWTPGQVESAYARGLKLFRSPDAHGAACADCHAPDGIDLAAIAYPDAAILRRGLLHLSPEQVLGIVDFVHAQRRRFEIKAPCSTDWRPFQPSGAVLPGNTVVEQELSFFGELEQRGLLVARGKVDGPAAAQKAFDELAAIDLRKLPIGIALPRWTEDAFNGGEHSSFNDYLPAMPRAPRSGAREALLALDDAYLADPTEQNLRKLDEAVKQPGIMVAEPALAIQAVQLKYRSVLLASHLFRTALVGKPSWYDLPPVPLPHWNRLYNPFRKLGARGQETKCCFADTDIPEIERLEVKGMDANRFMSSFSHSWFTLGQLFDQTYLQSEHSNDGTTSPPFYWNLFRFPHDQIHQPFLNMHRVVMTVVYGNKVKGTPRFPLALSDGRRAPAGEAMLDADWFPAGGNDAMVGVVKGDPHLPKATDPRRAPSVKLRTNLMRMFLYLQRDLLKSGKGATRGGSIAGIVDRWRDLLRSQDPEADALAAEVIGLLGGLRP